MEQTKACSKCSQTKVLSEFQPRNGRPGARCFVCVKEDRKNYKRRKKDEIFQQKVVSGEILLPSDPVNNKVCDYCRAEKPKDSFNFNEWKCIDCKRIEWRDYRRSEYGKEKTSQWLANNQERMTQLQAEWYQRNKEKRNTEYVQRYHSDPLFKLQRVCKERIRIAFNSKNMQKSGKTVQYLNCNIPWLMAWFETNFTPEMTFDNHGAYWHMDHVIPVNLFDLNDSQQVILCFSWSNLSPLEASKNMSKHDSIDTEQIKRHVQNLVYFNNNQYNIEPYIDLCARYLRMTGSPLELYLPLQ
jgi:hypothetical protein